MLQEFLLQRMQVVAFGHILDGLDLSILHFRAEHEAGADQTIVDHDAARAAIAGTTAFLAACQMQGFAKDIEQRLLRLAEKLRVVTVDGGGYVYL